MVLPFWGLNGSQRALVCLNMIVTTAGAQALSGFVALVVMGLQGSASVGIVLVSGVAIIMYLVHKLCKERNRASAPEMKRNRRTYRFADRLRRWVIVLCVICFCMALSAVLILTSPRPVLAVAPGTNVTNVTALSPSSVSGAGGSSNCGTMASEETRELEQDTLRTVMTVVAILCIMPVYPVQQMFKVEYDAFLFDYQRQYPEVVTSMQYWVPVLSACILVPLLGVNWLVVYSYTDVDSIAAEWDQAAVLMIIAVVIFCLAAGYFMIVDPRLPTSASVQKALTLLDTEIAAVVAQRKLEKERMARA